MAKVITQATFDDVVKENMVEFEMSAEEAVNDAEEQFQSQVRQKRKLFRYIYKYSRRLRRQKIDTVICKTKGGHSHL